jgi:hypothetical protein
MYFEGVMMLSGFETQNVIVWGLSFKNLGE